MIWKNKTYNVSLEPPNKHKLITSLAVVLLFLCFIAVLIVVFMQEKSSNENIRIYPLVLTPMILDGNISDAKTAAKVGQIAKEVDLESYSGFFTVDERYNSSLFFWYFPPENQNDSAPLILWLQGCPGVSSLAGLFGLNGPYDITPENEVIKRKNSWNTNNHMLYIDNPVGTGFSFTEHEDGYARNQETVADNLYMALDQFFTLFPELQDNDFYISGESYAGKYATATSRVINNKKKSDEEPKMNLKGMAINNGYYDLSSAEDYGDFLYKQGVIDKKMKEEFEKLENKIKEDIEKEDWISAFEARERLLTLNSNVSSLVKKNRNSSSGLKTFVNEYPQDLDDFIDFIELEHVRNALHVGDTQFNDDKVKDYLKEDIMKPVTPWLSELLEDFPILFYIGQEDIYTPYTTSESVLKNLNWSKADEYKSAPRQQWYIGDDLAGYVKDGGNAYDVLVKDSGQLVSNDQLSMELINNFVNGEPFPNSPKNKNKSSDAGVPVIIEISVSNDSKSLEDEDDD